MAIGRMSPVGRGAGKGAGRCAGGGRPPARRGARTLARASASGDDRLAMDADHARAIAQRLHAADREEGGAPLLRHVARVAGRTPAEAQAVAWLHEALESTTVAEHELLRQGLSTDELRALRLLHRTADSRSDQVYLAHVNLIARAAGRSGHLARMVKIADLEDRALHPRVRPDGWSPPYELGLERLHAGSTRDESYQRV